MGQQISSNNSQDNTIENKALDEKNCGSCGERISVTAEACSQCGVKQRKPLSKTALLLLTFFLGGIGAHKFYIGKNWQGFLYILFCWTGIPGLIALIEFIIYAFTSREKLQQKYSEKGGLAAAVIVSAVVIVSVAGLLAEIAIPSFFSYKKNAYQSTVTSELQNLLVAERAYFAKHNKYSNNLKDLNFTPGTPSISIEVVSADKNCFEAIAVQDQLNETMSIDCNGPEQK